MKSEPPTPTRDPDNQFRQMEDEHNYIRNTCLPNFWGWGRGLLFPRWLTAARRRREEIGAEGRRCSYREI